LRDVRRQISKVANDLESDTRRHPCPQKFSGHLRRNNPRYGLHGHHAITAFAFRAAKPLIGDTQNDASVSPLHPNSDTPMLTVILIGGGIPTSNVSSEMADRRRSPTAQAASIDTE
jgi:hypothetical protein